MRRASLKRQPYLVHLLLLLGGLVMTFPFAYQLLMSVSSNTEITSVPPTFIPEQWRFDNYAKVFDTLPFLEQFGNSLLITSVRTIVQILLCTMAGYGFARMRFRGRNLLFATLLMILMVPNQIYLLPQYQLVQKMNLLESPWGVMLPGLFSAFGTFLLRQAFEAMPAELEEAARIDGAGHWRIFWQIMLPLARPSVFAVAITTVLWSWNELLWPLVVTSRPESMPLAVGIATLAGYKFADYAVMMAASTLAMVPIFVIFFSMQRRVIDGLAHSGIKG